MKYIQALFVLIFALVLAGFIHQNSGSVYLRYFSWSSPELPLSLFMIIAFAAGYAMAVALGFYGNIRNRVRASNAEKEVKRLSDDLDAARKAAAPSPEPAGAPETTILSEDETRKVDETDRIEEAPPDPEEAEGEKEQV